MKSKFLALLALSLFTSPANAGLFGACDDVKVPEIEIAVKAGQTKNESKAVLVPMIAFVEVMEKMTLTLLELDDGFWIPHSKQRKIEAVYDTAKNVIKIKEQKIKLGLMPFGSKAGCKYIQRIKISFNEKTPSYWKEFEQGSQYPRLIQFGSISKDIFVSESNKGEIKKLIETTKYTLDLPGQETFTGTLVSEGNFPSWYHAGYFMTSPEGLKVPVYSRNLDQKEIACLQSLVNSNQTVRLLGTTSLGDKPESRKLMLDDLVPNDPVFANCPK
ncbi:MAG: hypothetical protein ABL958_10700 [Bdellovibrionia bacterium]